MRETIMKRSRKRKKIQGDPLFDRFLTNLKLIDSHHFLELPMSTRLLYYDICARADCNGVLYDITIKKLMEATGAKDRDLNILITDGLVSFDGLWVFIDKHTEY